MPRRVPLVQLAKLRLQNLLTDGDTAIDATAGNGFDTLFLAEKIAPSGRVYSFDIQAAAFAATQQCLSNAGLLSCVELIQANHADMTAYIAPEHRGNIKVIMFNLGYLPRGDKRIITLAQSTLSALNAAVALLAAGGMMTVLAYPGHPGGENETAQVSEFCRQLPADQFTLEMILTAEAKPDAPRLLVLQKKLANLL